MGGTTFNDLTAWSYWTFVAFAIIVLNMTAGTRWSRLCLAALNLACCALLTGLPAAALLVVAFLLVHFIGRPRRRETRAAAIVSVGVLLGAAFLVHKLPVGHEGSAGSVASVLASLGFSYIFLRAIEYLRAAAAGETSDLIFAETINYLVPFHMLAAGPVMSFNDFRRHGTNSIAPALSSNDVLTALERIARGLFKKFVLANGLVESVFLTGFRADGPYFLLEVQMYYLFIYLDFSAYTDIAVGTGRLLGVATPENFNKPLGARNIVVFWERWHISLSQFIRRNLFIPVQLAGMRWTQGRHARLLTATAFLVSFVCCGLWHGLTWRFLIWGLLHAMALIACGLYRDLLVKRLGRAGADQFSARPLVRIAATVLTFEFVASSLAFLAHPKLEFLG